MAETISIKKTTFLYVAIVIALVAGIVIGLFSSQFFGLWQGNVFSGNASGFSDQDKNFLVNLANSQIALTVNKVVAQSDWCIASGGEWQTAQQPGELAISKEQAQSLETQGYSVSQKSDGNWIANVTILNRSSCVIPNKK
ncbi:MAG: hypothetical protein PHD95_07080 [Candidatus ainarchaeum sp.]|nr:hypothetical protein [Candidatus ainarchaeum sp.]